MRQFTILLLLSGPFHINGIFLSISAPVAIGEIQICHPRGTSLSSRLKGSLVTTRSPSSDPRARAHNNKNIAPAYLEVEDDFAEGSPHEPSLRDIPDDGRWQTEEYYHEIGHGEVDDEVICDSPHAVISVHRHTDQGIAYQADKKNQRVKSDQNPLVRRGKDVVLYH